ncbi:hypothetical protein [Streptomyces sp. RPT161]|uniref:hypothetical protein n=1 Tax=Streptomyces sp. RPT161 TaxID=3015993 RepID=UPI0022B8D6B4|nr:hypothetical protein [Streptomyces sp. RPT161]
MSRRRRLTLLATAALAVPLLAGCGHSATGSASGTPSATSTPGSSSASQLQQMQHKVDAAQSAADAADQDARSN